MSTSKWEQYEFESRVCMILTQIAADAASHHLGSPFLTA